MKSKSFRFSRKSTLGKPLEDDKRQKSFNDVSTNITRKDSSLKDLTPKFSFMKKTSMKVDKTKYILLFESIYTNDEVGDAFQDYLKTEYNEEPLKFLRAVLALKTSKEEFKYSIEPVKAIMKNYIVDGAPYEVNISFKTKDKLLQQFKPQENEEEWILKVSPYKLFKVVAKIVREELFHDNWKRFIRTDVVEKIITKYYHDKTVCTLKIVQDFPFDDEHFRHPYVEDKDFEFSKSLVQDNSDWELIGTKVENQVNTFFSLVNYFPTVCYAKKAVSIKYECVLPYSLDRCCLGYLTNKSLKASDPNTMHIETHKYLSREEVLKVYEEKGKLNNVKNYESGLTINTAHITFGFPFNPRIYEYGGGYHYDPKERLLVTVLKCHFDPSTDSLQTYRTDAVTKKNGKKIKNTKCYPMFEYMITVYHEIDDKKVLFSQVNVCDASGWTNGETLPKLLAKARGLELRNTLHKMASEFPEDTKIEDYKDELLKEVDGQPFNGLGKLLWDTRINEKKQNELQNQLDEILSESSM
eukprot:gene2120-1986_t